MNCYLCLDTGLVPVKEERFGYEYDMNYSCHCEKRIWCPGMVDIDSFPFREDIEKKNRELYGVAAKPVNNEQWTQEEV